MRLMPHLIVVFLLLGISSGHAQQVPQTQLQAYAQQLYNAYNAARVATWQARSQGQPEYVVNQLLANERAAWDAFTQANNAAGAEAYQNWLIQYAASLDAALVNWQNHVQSIYNSRDNARYANDYTYRTWWDAQAQPWLTQANYYINELTARRQQLSATQTPPPPVSYDPRYSTPDGGPIAESWQRSLTIQ